MPTVVLRMSCIYGPRQLGTEDQGWVAHFVFKALAGEPITIYGDGRQVRDILHVDDAVAAYVAAWRRIEAVAGQAFNLGGGPDNAVSLRHLLRHIEAELAASCRLCFAPWRPDDQRWFVADARRAQAALGLADADRLARRHGSMLHSFASARGGCRHEGRADQPALAVRGQHLFRLPRTASAAGTGLRKAACWSSDGHQVVDAGRPSERDRCRRAGGTGAGVPAGHDRGDHGAELSVLALRAARADRAARVAGRLLDGAGDDGGDRAARFFDAARPRCASSASMSCCKASRMRRSLTLADAGRPDGVPGAAGATAATVRSMAGRRRRGSSICRRWPGRMTGSRGTATITIGSMLAPDAPGAEVEASRGCPYACSFCAKIDFRDGYRRRELGALLAEIDAADRPGRRLRLFHRRDLPAATPAAGSAARRAAVQFGVQTRIDLWKPEMLDLLGAAGCVSVEAGVESLTPEGRDALDKRCRLSTDELTEPARSRAAVDPVRAGQPDQSADDDAEMVAAWRMRSATHMASGPTTRCRCFRIRRPPDYRRLWGEPDDQAWERAHAHYLAQFDHSATSRKRARCRCRSWRRAMTRRSC